MQKKNKIDILHLHLLKSILIGTIVSFFGTWKVIVHEHGTIVPSPFLSNMDGFKRWLYVMFLRTFKNRINSFVAVSEGIRKALINRAYIPLSKIEMIYNCINLKEYDREFDRRKVRAEIGIGDGEIVLGFLGRLVEQKGCRYLIEAIKNISKVNRSIVILVIGDGKLRQSLMEMSSNLNNNRRAIFLGFQKDIKKLLVAFDIAIIPSIYEGFPIVPLQFMALKIPIIASNVDGLSELIKHKSNGFLVRRGSAKELSNVIEKLIVDEKIRENLTINGYGTVQKFDLYKAIPHFRSLYLELLSNY
ncbi:MAG: glycosyltransferase family 4 protein [Candidatus Bathyarchaeota archaeon]|nr:glycosyltransferase family 4 protein [Candidatus Bathyarchaeota archaeon]